MKTLLPRLSLFALFCVAAIAPLRAADEQPLRVVTLHTVLTEIARAVGGAKAEVNGLVGPGIDPHTFDPSAADMRASVDADLILVSGLHLESYLDRLVAKSGPRGRVLMVGDALPMVLSFAKTPGENHDRELLAAEGEQDPHWWHSIDDVLFATDLVRAEFSRLRPAWADEFARNAQTYEQRLFALKSWAAGEIRRIPPARRQLVTSHDAFGYFARDFGFTLHAISGLSPDSEPDAKHFAELINLIRRERIPGIFAESAVNPQLVTNLVSETGVRVGGTLYADGLGPEDATTYDGMYRHNVRVIVEALAIR